MELLVRMVSRETADRVLYCARMHRGDTVAIQPDGWTWSTQELTNPEWRILRMSTFTPVEADALTSPELDISEVKPYTWVKRLRHLVFESQVLSANLEAYLDDPTRVSPIYDVTAAGEEQQIRDIVTDKGNATDITPIYVVGQVPTVNMVINQSIVYPSERYFDGSLRLFTFTTSALPAGLTISNLTGIISGIPTVIGTSGVTIQGTDTASSIATTNSFDMVVSP